MRRVAVASAVLAAALPVMSADAQTKDPVLRDVKPAPPFTLLSERRRMLCGTVIVSPDAKTQYTMRQVTPAPPNRSTYAMHRATPPECSMREPSIPRKTPAR
jgi:hypothetical protein